MKIAPEPNKKLNRANIKTSLMLFIAIVVNTPSEIKFAEIALPVACATFAAMFIECECERVNILATMNNTNVATCSNSILHQDADIEIGEQAGDVTFFFEEEEET